MATVGQHLPGKDAKHEPKNLPEAFARYGKGRHSARSNFGDLFAYALAKLHDEPLLFKGGDFAKTDAKSAV